jgi:hypothetical protein
MLSNYCVCCAELAHDEKYDDGKYGEGKYEKI